MTSPLQEYLKSTYDRTVERLREEQAQRRPNWLNQKLADSSRPEHQITRKEYFVELDALKS